MCRFIEIKLESTRWRRLSPFRSINSLARHLRPPHHNQSRICHFYQNLSTLRAGPIMDMISNYTILVPNLERQELECAANGTNASPQVYGQLLAIYLLINDLPNAKLLWKRIPQDVKEGNCDLQAVWSVGVKLHQRDLAAIYALVDQFEWPGHLKNIMNCIKESTRERMLSLISKAYNSIRLQDLAILLGQSEPEIAAKVASLGWTYDATSGFVTPSKVTSPADESTPASFDQLMTKLTEYVAFLEN